MSGKNKISEIKKKIEEKGSTPEVIADMLKIIEKLQKEVDTVNSRCDEMEDEISAIGEEFDCMKDGMQIEDYSPLVETSCPYCQEKIQINLEELEDDEEFKCPHCGKEVSIEWDSSCDCGCGHDHGECDCEDNNE